MARYRHLGVSPARATCEFPSRAWARWRARRTPAPPAAPPAATSSASRCGSRATASCRGRLRGRGLRRRPRRGQRRGRAGRGRGAARRGRGDAGGDRRRARRPVARPRRTRPSWPPTRCTARWAWPRATAPWRLPPVPGRTLVAMSGGVDSAAAAQLALDAGEDVVAVTLELWSDPGTDGEQSCCSPQAVTGARALAHGMGIPHLTLDLRDELPRRGGGRLPGRLRRRRHPQPVRALQRPGSLRRHAGRWPHALGAGRAGHRPLRAHRATTARARWCARAPIRPRTRATCWPGSPATSSRGCASRSASWRSRACASWPRPPGLPVADKRESQDLCFLAGSSGARLHAPPRRPRRAARRRHRGPRRRACSDATTATTGFTVGQRRGIGVAAPEPLYVLAKDARRNRVVVGAARRARPPARVAAGAGAAAPVRRRGATRVRLRYGAARHPVRAGRAAGDQRADRPRARGRRGRRRVRPPA